MIRVNVYATGSKGNTTILTDTITKRILVIDCGAHSPPRLKFEKIDGLLITHSHRDHTYNVREYKRIPIYGSYSTLNCEWVRKKIPKGKYNYMLPERHYTIGPFTVIPYLAQHDANEPYHYKVMTKEDSIWFGCDACKYNDGEFIAATSCRRILVDCNYDEYIISHASHYPESVRDRIINSGHASNQYICNRFKDYKKKLVLCHISSKHNSIERIKEVFGKRINIAPKILK